MDKTLELWLAAARAQDDADSGFDLSTPEGWQAWAVHTVEAQPDLADVLRSLMPDTAELAAGDEPTAEAGPAPEMFRTFTDQPIAVLGEETTDNRILADDGDFTFADTPMALQWTERNEGGHMGSCTVGVIEKMSKKDNKILGSGYLLNIDPAEKAANLLAHKVASPSADMGRAEWHYTDEKGNKLDSNEAIMEHLENGGSLRRKITKGHIVGATLVPFPAIGSATLALDAERQSRDVGLVAAAQASFSPRVYAHAHFEDPKLSRPTPLTMDENGRIYGHLAVFGQCHRSVQSECVMVPRSPSEYAHFHTSPPVRLDDGKRLAVGRLTVGTGHADPRLRPAPAAAHYDNTGACFALVRAGEDEHGVWVSGVAAPWATTEQIEMGLHSPLSGDWRNFGQGLDLVAALSVNTPGFAVVGADDDEGHPATLVASVGPARTTRAISLSDIERVVRNVLVEVTLSQQQAVEQAQAAVEELQVETEVEPAAPSATAVAQREAAEAATAADAEAGKSFNEQAAELLERVGA